MNLLSTTFLFLAFFLAGVSRISPLLKITGMLLLYGLAVFDYDQVFFMWIPLIYYALCLSPSSSFSPRQSLIMGGVCLGMNVTHVALRILCPVSSGGRPTIRWEGVGRELIHSLTNSLVPLRKLPIWGALQSWAGGPARTLILVITLSALFLWAVATLWDDNEEQAAEPLRPGPAILFGTLWFFCAYLPNYFWFISPRHNYLPSFGLVLTLVATASWFLDQKRPKGTWARRGLGALVFLFFGLSSAANIAEGYAWNLSSLVHERFKAQAPALVPDKPDNLFLIGAPLSLLRAPAFSAPGENLYLFSEATGHQPALGDIVLAPGRTGAFFGNQVEAFGKESLWWRDYTGMNVILHAKDESFRCLSSLQLSPPGLPLVAIPLSLDPRCIPSTPLHIPVWLVSSQEDRTRVGAPLFAADNGASLLEARLRSGQGFIELELVWKARIKIIRDFASAVSLLDSSGRAVFEPVYALETLGRPAHKLFWPAHNDIDPPSRWKPGVSVREIYHFKSATVPEVPLEIRLTLFERAEPGPWRKIGDFKAPLEK
jgi:hypothetical protein